MYRDAACGGLFLLHVCRYVVSTGCVGPLCDMLSVPESRMISVALEGLENILKVGSRSPQVGGVNPYAKIIEEVYGERLCIAPFLLATLKYCFAFELS